MKIQIASDLHLEFLERPFPGYRVITPAPGAGVLILAGDIHNGVLAVNAFRDWPVPVLYVPGNHEFYGHSFECLRADLKREALGTSVTVLDDDVFVLGGVRFLGSTMWTDYRLNPRVPPKTAMAMADMTLADAAYIAHGNGDPFTSSDALAAHIKSRRWLSGQIGTSHDGPTVVITHHGCSRESTAQRFMGSALNGAFMSNLEPLMGPEVRLWVHGHVHDTFDYCVKSDIETRVKGCASGTRIVANPRGYALNLSDATTVGQVKWENPSFIPDFVVEL